MESTERKNTFDRFVDLLIDRIILFTDYFIVAKHVTLSEAAVFSLSALWAIWFAFSSAPLINSPLTRSLWITVFAMTAVAHFISFFFKDILGRAIILCIQATLFCFLSLLSVFVQAAPPAFPTLFVFTILSCIVAVKLFHERQKDKLITK